MSKADGLRLLAAEKARQAVASNQISPMVPAAPSPPPTAPVLTWPANQSMPDDADHSFADGAAHLSHHWDLDGMYAARSSGVAVVFVNRSGTGVAVAQMTASGALDPSFGVGGWVTDPTATAATVDSAGRVLLHQWLQRWEYVQRPAPYYYPEMIVESTVRRLNGDGNPDTSFAGTGSVLYTKQTSEDFDTAVASCRATMLPRGESVVIAYTEDTRRRCSRNGLVHISGDGTVDDQWGAAALNDPTPAAVTALGAGPNGSTIVAARRTYRITSAGAIDPTFHPPHDDWLGIRMVLLARPYDVASTSDGGLFALRRTSLTGGNMSIVSPNGTMLTTIENAGQWTVFGPAVLIADGPRAVTVDIHGPPGQVRIAARRSDGTADLTYNGRGQASWTPPFGSQRFAVTRSGNRYLAAGQAADGRVWVSRAAPPA